MGSILTVPLEALFHHTAMQCRNTCIITCNYPFWWLYHKVFVCKTTNNVQAYRCIILSESNWFLLNIWFIVVPTARVRNLHFCPASPHSFSFKVADRIFTMVCTGIELIFLILLCFGFVMETMLVTHWCFIYCWVVLTHNQSIFSPCFAREGWRCISGWEKT